MAQDSSPKTDVPEKKSVPKVETKAKAKAKAPRPVYFHANIHLHSQVELLEDNQVQVEVNGQKQILPIAANQVEKVRQHSPKTDQTYILSLWFRTADEQVTNLELAGLFETKRKKDGEAKPKFDVAGRLEAVDKEEGLVKIKIEANPNGKLKEAFVIDVWAALELMEKLPKIGKTVVAIGEYRPGSGRLVAKSIFAKKLGQKSKAEAAVPSETSQPS